MHLAPTFKFCHIVDIVKKYENDVKTQVGCSGSEVNVEEKDVNLAKSGLKFDVKVSQLSC